MDSSDLLQCVKDTVESGVGELAMSCEIAVGRLSNLEAVIAGASSAVSSAAGFVEASVVLTPFLCVSVTAMKGDKM